MKTQNDRLHEYLLQHKRIDPMTAWNALGIYRLGARVWDLKRRGVPISTTTTMVKNRYSEECRVALYVLGGEA